ncbi:MAG: long-chain-fatty-acid--CoA ligase [Acidobacteria bacterium]|nr:long-chain-fatty-acid--CoA ligase [Acidobacteriota bacterium]
MKLPLTPLRCLLRAAQEYPSKVGVVDGDRRIPYSEFLDRTCRLAAGLKALGIGPGDRVASLSFNCHHLLELYYGAPMARAILLSLNVRLAPEEQTYILRHSGSKLVLFDPEFLPLAEALRAQRPELRWLSLQERADLPDWVERPGYEGLLAAAEPSEPDFTGYDEDAIAELFYTSGSTGRPKGVMLSHRTLYMHAIGVLLGAQRLDGLRAADKRVEMHSIPLFHANGWGRAHTVTLVGGRHVMLKRFEPKVVCELIEREGVTSFSMVPTMATALLHCEELDRYDLSSLEEITLGGAASSPALIRALEQRLGCRAVAGYGLTESGPVAATAHAKSSLGPLDDEERIRRQAMTGVGLPGAEMRVVDEQGAEVPRDLHTIGEVQIRGDLVMDGYWAEPEATAEAMDGTWLRTGDMACWDSERYVLIVDRKKDIIISGGENISSLEIEKVIAELAAVGECAVIGVPDAKWGETPKAIVTLKPGCTATEQEIRDHVRAHLAHFKVPSSVEIRDELPKGATGKILKRALREPYWAGLAKRVQG